MEYIEIYTGERYDFILHADQGSVGDEFLVRVGGLIDCQHGHLQQSAVLRYLGNQRKSTERRESFARSPQKEVRMPAFCAY